MARVILLVDDEAAHRMMARRALAAAVPQTLVVEADGIAAAEELLKQHHLDLLVVDYNLNNECGVELLQSIRTSRERAVPIIVVSTSELLGDITAAYEAGADCFVVKSSDPKSYRADLSAAALFLLRQRAARC